MTYGTGWRNFLTDKCKALLGFCRKAGKAILGAEALEASASRCYLIFLSSDAAERTERHVRALGIRTEKTDLTKQELGHLLGCREAAAVGIADRNLADAIIKNI